MKKVIFTFIVLFNISLFAQSDTLFFLFDDFDDLNDTTAIWGGPWEEFADATSGSGFTKEFADYESHAGSAGSVHLTGKFASYGGVAAYFKADKVTSRNLNYDGITFWAFSNAPIVNTVRFRIREKKAEDVRGWNYFCYDFMPAAEWTKVTIPFDSLKLSWSDPSAVPFSQEDLYAIDFGPARGQEDMDVFIDDISFYKVLENGDQLIFDDFNDQDSANVLWGGFWSVYKDANAASTINGEISLFESYNNSPASVHVWGQYASYGGFVTNLNPQGTDINMKGLNALSFWAKGDPAGDVYVRLRERKAENLRSWNYFGYRFTPQSEWTYYQAAFDSLTLVYGGTTDIPFTTEDIYAFDIGPASGNTNIDVYLDDITFRKDAGTVDVKNNNNNLPQDYSLEQNYPNPFNPSTTINFSIAQSGYTTLKVYDITGKEISELIHKEMAPGNYTVNFDATGLASGLYLYRLSVNNITLSNKMLLMK